MKQMMKMKEYKKILKSLCLISAFLALGGFASCSDTESYSDLLRDEEHAVNWYLASQKVENRIPADSISFLTGKDAPFYRLDEDGSIYMQVISKGNMDDRVKDGDVVYFRFDRTNLLYLCLGDTVSNGNATDIANGSASFVYGNTYLTSTTSWGTGVQVPLKFFGYNSEVNLVLKSSSGFTEDQTNCIPFVMNVRYFKPEY